MVMKSLADEINLLSTLSRSALIERWEFFYKSKPPKGLSSKLMTRAIAYQMQMKKFGGLKPKTIRRLMAITSADNSKKIETLIKEKSRFNAGTRLVREWNGVNHVVDVLADGFEWRGNTYRSLSKIAREITGAHWSGPRFFGLVAKAGGAS